MRILTLLSFIVTLLVQYSCTTCSVKKVPCGAFDEPAFFKWFPYRDKDVLSFKNTTTADTFSYVMYRLDSSEAYEASRGGYNNTTRGCVSSASVSTWGNAGNQTYFSADYSILKTFDNGPVEKNLYLTFYGSQWYAGEVQENTIQPTYGLQPELTTISTTPNLLFDNGITYPYVVTLQKDTVYNKADKVYKLFIAKNSGIIGFEMYPSNQRWIIQ